MKLSLARVLLGLAIVCSISFLPQAHARHHGYGRLIILRSATFGTLSVMQIYIDGIQVGSIGLGHRYDAPIAAGRHVLAITYVPNTRHVPLTPIAITVHPGESYVFTGMWTADQRVVLRPAGFSAY